MNRERTLAASGAPLRISAQGRVFSEVKVGGDRYPALTGVRALGAMVVFFDHFPLFADSRLTLNVMAFFFALSGFLIVRIYFEQASLERRWLAKYFVNRFARIYPIYFLLLTVAVVLHHGFRTGVLLANYTLTHALFSNITFIIQPSWSLTVEECFYFLAPLFMILIRVRSFPAAFSFASLMLLAALLVSGLHIGFLGTRQFVLSTTFFGHFMEFFAGVYIALAVVRIERQGSVYVPGSKRTIAGAAGVGLLAFAMIMVYRRASLDLGAVVLINNFLIPFPIALLYWGLIREKTLLARLLSGNVLRLLGRASYSFYLLHTIVIDYVSAPLLASTGGSRPLYVFVTFICTWLISILLFLLYEEPINIFIRGRFTSPAFRTART